MNEELSHGAGQEITCSSPVVREEGARFPVIPPRVRFNGQFFVILWAKLKASSLLRLLTAEGLRWQTNLSGRLQVGDKEERLPTGNPGTLQGGKMLHLVSQRDVSQRDVLNKPVSLPRRTLPR